MDSVDPPEPAIRKTREKIDNVIYLVIRSKGSRILSALKSDRNEINHRRNEFISTCEKRKSQSKLQASEKNKSRRCLRKKLDKIRTFVMFIYLYIFVRFDFSLPRFAFRRYEFFSLRNF